MDLYAKYRISKEEVLKWAREKYPQFLKNESVLAQLYLTNVKRITVDVKALEGVRGDKKMISALKLAEWGVIEALVGLKTRENPYKGCPECFKKVNDMGSCDAHGDVTARTYRWSEYIVGDNSGDMIMSVPPVLTEHNPSMEGKVIKALVVLKDDGTLFMKNFEEINSGISPELAKKKSDDVLSGEISRLKEVLSVLPDISEEDIRRWHTKSEIKLQLEQLLDIAGYVLVGGRVYSKDKAPATQPAPEPAPTPTQLVATPPVAESPKEVVEPKTLSQAEIDGEKLRKILVVFEKLPKKEVEEWYKSQKIKTPLEEVIKTIGAVEEGGIVILKK